MFSTRSSSPVRSVRTAQTVLSMCIRATDYLPPVDPTFSDFLRAMITADFELNRSDEAGLRADMIEAFRQRGIQPEAVGSLAVPSLLLPPEDETAQPDAILAECVTRLVQFGIRELSRTPARRERSDRNRPRKSPRKLETPRDWILQQSRRLQEAPVLVSDTASEYSSEEEPEDTLRVVAQELGRWARANPERLRLEPGRPIAVRGFHPVHRSAPSGELLVEMVAHFVQTRELADDLGGLKYRAGTTLIADVEGRIRYLISKPFHEQRETRLHSWVQTFDFSGGRDWESIAAEPDRLLAAYSARAMDARRWR